MSNVNYSQADQANNLGFITVKSTNSLTGVVTIYKCKQLVSSVSLNVLKNTPNLFTPALPATITNSLNRLKLGVNNKIFYVFSQSVFPTGSTKTGVSFLVNKNLPFSLNADATCNIKVNV